MYTSVIVEQDLQSLDKYKVHSYQRIGSGDKLIPIVIMGHFINKQDSGVFDSYALSTLTGSKINGIDSLITYLMLENPDILNLFQKAINEKTNKDICFGKNVPYIRKIINEDNGDIGYLFMNAIFAASCCFWGEEKLTTKNMQSGQLQLIQQSPLGKSLKWYTEKPETWGMPLFILECFTSGFKCPTRNGWTGEEYKHINKWPFRKFPYENRPKDLEPEKFFPISSEITFDDLTVSNDDFIKLAKFQEPLNF